MVMHSQFKAVYGENYPSSDKVEDGFVDQYGNFYNREEARNHAVKVGQEIEQTGGENHPWLFSEDLY